MKSTIVACLLAVSDGLKKSALKGSWDLPHMEGYFPIAGPSSPDSMGQHSVALWRQKPDYFTQLAHKSPKTGEMVVNSCHDKDVSVQDVCSSRGTCAPWDQQNIVSPIFFCKCDFGYAGPECRLTQKSQTTAWFLSCVGGWFGADEYYLEQRKFLLFKLIGLFFGGTLMACGANHVGQVLILSYWLYDIVRIGSGPVQSGSGHTAAKVAADLPHWGFACFTVIFFGFFAFFLGVWRIYWKINEKRRKADNNKYYCACDEYGAPLIDAPKNFHGGYDPADKRTQEPWNSYGLYEPKKI